MEYDRNRKMCNRSKPAKPIPPDEKELKEIEALRNGERWWGSDGINYKG